MASTTTSASISEVDVLIIGAGPAGLMLAASLSLIDPTLKVRIVDQGEGPVVYGHADGFQCRTVEVFKSLGIAHRVVNEGNEVAECVFYDPDPKNPKGGLVETSRTYDTPPGTSHFRHVLLGQGRVEQFLMDRANEASGLEVQRLTHPTGLHRSPPNSTTHPITVTLSSLAPPPKKSEEELQSGLYRSNMFTADPNAGKVESKAGEPLVEGTPEVKANGNAEEVVSTEEVKCRYLVGCDGARSWVRKQLGLRLQGDSANTYWGVVDAKALTDMPTIRMKNLIHSAEDGSILTVPRERGYTRLYVQMGTLEPGQRVDRSEVTIEKILAKAQKILAPYKLECPEVEWFTCYEIGQRLCDQFSVDDNVFIAGDACHTHSPKAGQGMNISMMDTYNLSWKLVSVLRGIAKPELLKTYQSERHAVAHDLITFDHKFSRLFSGKPSSAEEEGISTDEFRQAFAAAMKWASGTGVTYKPSMIMADPSTCRTDLAKKVTIGGHYENHQVVCIADAHPIQLQHMLRTDGRWRLMLFPGDIRAAKQLKDLKDLCSVLEDPKGPIRKYTRSTADLDSVIQVYTTVATPRLEVKLSALPGILQPEQSPYGIRAWDTIFADDATYHEGHGHAYKAYGIDPLAEEGCMVLVRPDQHVAAVLSISDVAKLDAVLGGVLLQQQ